ncbi:hypothetical protein I545_5584 [Mycobacterium kansasii 662]|uniref:Uncharacterized protein n=2 Tax=Mycobacterium kansasii TaxID=1768 RepID=A0A1V3WI52_MYCKA|nr:hypothetical protein I545_5584 [Mycobacterium kansasii 662]KEP42256.1 hypothetical protein MKSMC1_26330 [Mycobacterium kansasii]OOK66448.1 hypothetical protein BZL30_8289 [Mycobacterium kansasii]
MGPVRRRQERAAVDLPAAAPGVTVLGDIISQRGRPLDAVSGA